MKLLLVASAPLRPVLMRMLPASPHDIDLAILPEFTPESVRVRLAESAGYDAALLLDGAAAVAEDGLSASMPLVLPRVHNCAALLLGGADTYRALFEQLVGELCFRLPETQETLFFTPRADCSCLCCLTDTRLGLRDGGFAARAEAVLNGWDCFNAECDYTLLERLISGDWDAEHFVTVPAGAAVGLTYTRDLLAAV